MYNLKQVFALKIIKFCSFLFFKYDNLLKKIAKQDTFDSVLYAYSLQHRNYVHCFTQIFCQFP